MINVNQITSQLARMPDQALQKYAMMNKNDPYTVALALSESNRRKAMRAGAAPMPGQQPKVVDQDIAQMASVDPMGNVTGVLPEDTGIGKLPAPNMKRMADGGIVGYADRGLVYGGQYGGGNLLPDMTGYEGMSIPEVIRALKNKFSYNPLTPTVKSQTAYQSGIDIGGPGSSPMNTGRVPTPDEIKAAQLAASGNAPVGNTISFDSQNAPSVVASPAASATAGAPTQLPPSLVGPGLKVSPPAGLPSVQSFTDQLLGIAKIMPAKEKEPNKEAFMKERADISAPVWTKFESTLNKEKDRLNEGKEQDFYMALIEGGLEAAAGNSPNGIQNIAAGFGKGAKSYAAALKDFRKAAQENTKMELDMERAKAAEKRGDLDAFQKAEDSVKNRNAELDRLRTQGIFALQNAHTAGAYHLAGTQLSGQYHLAGADLAGRYNLAAHAMPTGVERMVTQMPGQTFGEKLQAYSNIMGPDARSESMLLQKYAGKEGEMALRLLEAGSAEDQAYARMIRSRLQGAMRTPMDTPIGAARP